MMHSHSFRLVTISKVIIGTLFLLIFLALSACGSSSSTNTPSPVTPTTTQQQTDTATPGVTTTAVSPATTATSQTGYPIQVYFSKFQDSLNNNNAVFPVNRISPTIAVATYAIQLLIAGPTTSERSAGYFSEFNSILTGPSSCSAPYPTGGPDFTIALNMKGSTPVPGTATLKLCRATNSPGIGADARIQAEIDATLKQFSNIKNVVILTQVGHCFGDESGLDHCLK
ncbi:MAG: hypothetical protein ACXWOL_09840 [Ktedonobacteraceae bacterium]